MSDELNFRPLKEEDYETICKWWKWWRWPIIPREILPDEGKSGFMVEKNKQPIVSCFLYITNSKVALLEWIVSSPDYKQQDRKKAIELLINSAEGACKTMGFKCLFSIGRNSHLIKIHKKLGWSVETRHSYEITKII